MVVVFAGGERRERAFPWAELFLCHRCAKHTCLPLWASFGFPASYHSGLIFWLIFLAGPGD